MNKLLLSLTLSTLIVGAFAGCASKGNANNTSVKDLDDAAIYDSAVADTGWRVTGNLTSQGAALTAGANGSAASVKVVDLAPDDAGGALDKADFLLDAKEADGSRLQAELRSMTTAHDEKLGGDFFGGVAHNIDINGDSGIGYPELPKVKAYLLMTGLARVKYNDQSVDGLQLVQVAVTKGFHHNEDGDFLATPEENDLELHVIFPGVLMDAAHAFPGVTDGFVYYYFENVKLTQMGPDEKSQVGANLKPAERANELPVASAVVTYKGDAVAVAEFNPEAKFLNVTLDASNSTDADGTIEAYSWDVKELDVTGAVVSLNRTSGQTAEFSFTSPGKKFIELRVIDNDGGIANASITFILNYKITFTYDFSASQLSSAGVGVPGTQTECVAAFNCNNHQISVQFGATQMKVGAPVQKSGNCNSGAVTVKDPSGTVVGSGASATINADKLQKVGRYSLDVHFTAQLTCKYAVDVTVLYAPVA